MVDAIGNEIEACDEVVYLDTWIRKLRVGRIMYLTPKGATIMDSEYSTWEVNRPSGYIILKESVA